MPCHPTTTCPSQIYTHPPIHPPTHQQTRHQAHDPRHLVMDGRQGVDPGVLDCPDVDVVSRHYYPAGDGRSFRQCLQEDLAVRFFGG